MVTDQLRRQGSFAINSSSTSIVLGDLKLGRTIEFTDNVAIWQQVYFVLNYILPMQKVNFVQTLPGGPQYKLDLK